MSVTVQLPTLHLWPPLFAVLVPFALGAVLMPWFIGRLSRTGMGQKIRPEGPAGHSIKEGTPTGGGLFVIVLVLLTVLLMDRSPRILPQLAALVVGGAFGLLDDVVTTHSRSRGLLARQRIGIQLIIGIGLAYWLAQLGADRQLLPWGAWRMGALFVPVAAVAFVACANAFNLTDGSDGLAPGVMLLVALAVALIARRLGDHNIALVRLMLATAGALLAFMLYNLPPARVFLGGVGAEGVGTMLAAAAIGAGLMWYLPLLALVPVVETASVIIQVYSFRRYGRRVFRMSPIHHHFQLGGWGEWRIALSAWGITAASGAVSLLLARGRA